MDNRYAMDEVTMGDKAIASRIKSAILNKFTYEQMEQASGISISTLKRMMNAQRDVTIPELKLIGKLTGKDPIYLAFGNEMDMKSESENDVKNRSQLTRSAHNFVVRNLQILNDEDIKAIARQVSALCTITQAENHKMMMENIDQLKDKVKEKKESNKEQ